MSNFAAEVLPYLDARLIETHGPCLIFVKSESITLASIIDNFPALLQITDVYSGTTFTVKDTEELAVRVNPTGVLMWRLSAPAKRKPSPSSKMKLFYHKRRWSHHRSGTNDVPYL